MTVAPLEALVHGGRFYTSAFIATERAASARDALDASADAAADWLEPSQSERYKSPRPGAVRPPVEKILYLAPLPGVPTDQSHCKQPVSRNEDGDETHCRIGIKRSLNRDRHPGRRVPIRFDRECEPMQCPSDGLTDSIECLRRLPSPDKQGRCAQPRGRPACRSQPGSSSSSCPRHLEPGPIGTWRERNVGPVCK